MKDGRFFKEKKEYVLEKYTTLTGLFDVLIGSFLWAYIILNYSSLIMGKIRSIVPVDGWLNSYLAYLAYGIFASFLGLFISYVISSLYGVLTGKNGRS